MRIEYCGMAPDLRQFPGVPLLGQPVEVIGWTMVVNVRCKCDHPSVVQLVVKQSAVGLNADVGLCPGCARPLHLATFKLNDAGHLEFGVGMGEAVSQPAVPAN